MASQWALNQRAIGAGRKQTQVVGGKGQRVRAHDGRLGTVHVAYSRGTKDHELPYAIVDFDDNRRERIALGLLSLA